MSGLSPAALRRIEQLEKKPELAPAERGELRSMTHSAPTAEERMRVERLLISRQPTTPPSGETPTPPEGAAYDRGMQRGMAQGGKAYTRTNER